MNFGIPYMGSKSQIAGDIIQILPSGKRLVDLFGGGGAITHAALLSGKWDEVYFNELNPLVVPLLKDALLGKYDYSVFKPKFITRKDFFEKKDSDGYVRYIWSFGNRGDTYLFGADIEGLKEKAHNLVVFGIEDNALFNLFEGLRDIKHIPLENIKARRKFFCNLTKKENKKTGLEQIAHLSRLERLQYLQQLQQLERLADFKNLNQNKLIFNTGSYIDYIYREGDIVYCDPPYEGTKKYNNDENFNHKQFYDWVASRPFEVFFSSYDNISDKRFFTICQFEKISLLNGGGGAKKVETIYSNFNNKQELF